jgi:ATP-binding cassette, subfamily B, bacterial
MSVAAIVDRFPALRGLGQRLAGSMPELRQSHPVECGGVCLTMILCWFGRQTQLGEVREILRASRDGVTALGILAAARQLGLRGRGVRVDDVDDLAAIETPAILHWQFNHFVVLERWHRGRLHLVDPARGRRVVSAEDAAGAFTGVVLCFEPGEGFLRRAGDDRPLWRALRRALVGRPLLARLLLVSVLLQVLALALPVLTGCVVDRVVPGGDGALLGTLGIAVGAAVVLYTLAMLVRTHLLVHLRTHVDAETTVTFMDHLGRLPLGFFQVHSAGDLQNRIHSNATIRELLTSAVASTLLDGATVAVYLAVLLAVSPSLALLVAGLGALQVLIFLAVRGVRRGAIAHALDAQVRSQGYLMQVLAGIETLKASGAEGGAIERWTHLYVDELNASLARDRISAWLESLLAALRVASPLVVLLHGAGQVVAGEHSLGVMLAMAALAQGFLGPLSATVGALVQMQLLATFLRRLADVLETPPEQDLERVAPPPRVLGEIEMQAVSFRYSPMAPDVVRDVSLHIRRGQCVALVGPSGCGKSTLARLLVGLHTPTAGRVLHEGHDLSGLDVRALRSRMGIVTQTPHLFGGSVRKEIALSTPGISLDGVVAAARQACIHEDVAAMPLAYETLVGDGGASLSGGQRQRVAVARALAKNPPVLLLDEATSALDAATEDALHANLAALGSTRIVIAHRLDTIARADVILCMDGGSIVERGTHEELLARRGKYWSLVAAQLRGHARAPSGAQAVRAGHPD